MKYNYTINGSGNKKIQSFVYSSRKLAEQAWIDAGKPQMRGSSVWITQHSSDFIKTIRTITLAK